MEKRTRTALMWGLFSVFFLLVLVLQTVVLGRVRVYGAKLQMLPMVIICLAMWTDHEKAAVFGLAAGLLWQMTGAEDGIVSIVLFPLYGAVGGWLFDSWLPRRLLPGILLCVAACFVQESVVFLLKFYVENVSWSLVLRLPVAVGLGLVASPVLYGLGKAIGKVGGA